MTGMNVPADVPADLPTSGPAGAALDRDAEVMVEKTTTGSRAGRVSLGTYLRLQLAHVHPRLSLAQLVVRCIPFNAFSLVRAAIYRAAGFRVAGGTRFAGPLTLWGTGDLYSRLTVGEQTFINSPAHIELNAPVRIGARCAIGHHLVIITTNHVLGPSYQRAGEVFHRPVTIGDGVWIGARVTILPGVTIGDGAFVTAGVLVSRDVAPNTQVSGARGETVRTLTDRPGDRISGAMRLQRED